MSAAPADRSNDRVNNQSDDQSDDRKAASPAIILTNLSKTFAGKPAIENLNLSINKGELFGVIGPDGAGKSTLCHILAGVMPQSSGTVTIMGKAARETRLITGYLTQHFSLYPELSVAENLRYFASTRGVEQETFRERSETLLDLVQLSKFTNRPAGNLSGGMKQKLALCCALISKPMLLLLDEPTNGVDPVSRREFWHLLSQVTHSGVTTVISTPNFAEAELCDRTALLTDGKLLKLGKPDALRSELDMQRLQFSGVDMSSITALVDTQIIKESNAAIADINVYGDRVEVLTSAVDQTKNAITSALAARGLSAQSSIEEPTLENVFVVQQRHSGYQSREALPLPRGINKQVLHQHQFALEARNLVKKFGDFTAVTNVNINVGYGQIYGLLGANGAGKTTTIKMLCRLIEPTSGTISLVGIDGGARTGDVRKNIGYMSQKFTLYEDLSVLENLKYYAAAYSIPGHLRKEKIDWVLSTCSKAAAGKSPVCNLPQGLKQKVAFGAAVMHEPNILFLDEPTSGLDPLARKEMWKSIRDLALRGTAILVSTHFLDDAEYCNTLGFMAGGKIVAEGSPSNIKATSNKLLSISVDDIPTAFAALAQTIDASRLSAFPRKLHIQLDQATSSLDDVLKQLKDCKIEYKDATQLAPSLEDSFVQIVRRERP